MLPANNRTLFGEWSDLKRGGVVTWGVVTLLLSLFGNTIILVASIRYKVIRHSKMTVTLIEHVAGSDLGLTLVGILPDVVTLFAFDWREVSWFCLARFAVHGAFVSTSTYLVCALNVCKLLSLKFPLRARLWSKRFATTLATLIWVFSVVASCTILGVGVMFNEMFFDYRTNMCMYKVTTPPMRLVGLLQTMLQWTIPDIVVVVSSIWIVVIAVRKARHSSRWRWQNVLTVLLIAAVFCVSYLPLSGMFTVFNFVLVKGRDTIETVNRANETELMYVEYDITGQPISGFAYSQLYLLLCMLTYLNSVANIFIYTASMASFKNSMRRMVCSGKQLPPTASMSLNSMMSNDGSIIKRNSNLHCASVK